MSSGGLSVCLSVRPSVSVWWSMGLGWGSQNVLNWCGSAKPRGYGTGHVVMWYLSQSSAVGGGGFLGRQCSRGSRKRRSWWWVGASTIMTTWNTQKNKFPTLRRRERDSQWKSFAHLQLQLLTSEYNNLLKGWSKPNSIIKSKRRQQEFGQNMMGK